MRVRLQIDITEAEDNSRFGKSWTVLVGAEMLSFHNYFTVITLKDRLVGVKTERGTKAILHLFTMFYRFDMKSVKD